MNSNSNPNSNPNQIQILPLTKADIPQAIECIQTVFADDPFFLYMFDQSTYNIARNAASLRAHFLHGLSIHAPIYVAKSTVPQAKSVSNTSRIVGICWWHPPAPTTSPTPLTVRAQDCLLSLRQFLANLRFAGRGGLHLHRYKQWKTLQSKTHNQVWSDPRGYYFCNVIAVRSEMRGMGVGRRLVEAVTERADEEGMGCYLESSKEMPNLVIYEKLGFGGVSEIECVDGKDICTLYCMIRPPVKKC
ncbi:acyl-CoA N-acyltransferase, partial [Aspergillus crustosus]